MLGIRSTALGTIIKKDPRFQGTTSLLLDSIFKYGASINCECLVVSSPLDSMVSVLTKIGFTNQHIHLIQKFTNTNPEDEDEGFYSPPRLDPDHNHIDEFLLTIYQMISFICTKRYFYYKFAE